MIDYANLMGGLITSEFPYLVMIGFGVWFAKQGIFHKEGAISFSKLMIEIFIPIYLFINIARSTSVITIQKNYLMIISVLCEMAFAALVSFIYIKIVKMDIRYRYSFLMLNCFSDIKNVHRLIINSFCYHLKDQTPDEKDYCSGVLKNNFVHMFFQSVITWYLAFNLIRIDRKLDRNIKHIQSEINGQVDKVANSNGKVNSEKKEQLKEVYTNYIKNGDDKTVKVTPEFYDIVSPFYHEDNKPWWREMIYVLMRPPLIAMFTGFIVGFITPIQSWIFNTTTAVYVRKFIKIINFLLILRFSILLLF
jgi:predicted permease